MATTNITVSPGTVATITNIKRLMFATDFSSASLAALPFAAAVARTFGSELHLFHLVSPEYEYPLLAANPVPLAPRADAEREAKRRMRDLARSALLSNVRVGSEEVALGRLGVLKKRIEQDEIDLVVVGTHGWRGFEHLLLGSFAEHLIRTAPCPVLTVGPHIKKMAEPEFRPRQVLFATDASPDSFRALHDAILFAEKRCELTLVYVLPHGHEKTPEADAFLALLREGLHSTVPLETIRKCNPEIVIKFGDPAKKILEAAAERESELIVTGARSAGKKEKGNAGVSYNVVVHSTCPVLTVRGREF